MKNADNITTLFVDDDALVLEDLKRLIPWEDLGFTIVGTARNGKQALKQFRALRPQLVITDVVMPLKDGIELIEAIKDMEPGTFFLILSSYDKFDYAKSALQLGVVDYLLKTEITAETLSRKLCSIYTGIKSTKKTYRRHQSLELQEYFEGSYDSAILPDSLLEAIRTKRFSFYCCSVSSLYKKSLFQEDFALFSPSLVADFSGKMKLTDQDLIFQADHYIFLGLSEHAKNIPQAAPLLFEEINRYFLSLEYQSAVFHYPGPCTISEFKKLYEMKKGHMDWHLFFPEARYVRIRPSLDTSSRTGRLLPAYEIFADALQKENGREVLERWLTQIHMSCCLPELIRIFNYLRTLFHQDPDDTIFRLTTFQAFKLWALDGFDLWRTPKAAESDAYSAHIKNAILCISNHYGNSSLSVEQIAEAAGISSGRLSVLFKKELGKTPVEYLTEYRMKMAIRLLLHSNYKIYEIANQVGYHSAQYFSQIFLQHTGQKPLDYRKSTLTTIVIGEKP